MVHYYCMYVMLTSKGLIVTFHWVSLLMNNQIYLYTYICIKYMKGDTLKLLKKHKSNTKCKMNKLWSCPSMSMLNTTTQASVILVITINNSRSFLLHTLWIIVKLNSKKGGRLFLFLYLWIFFFFNKFYQIPARC